MKKKQEKSRKRIKWRSVFLCCIVSIGLLGEMQCQASFSRVSYCGDRRFRQTVTEIVAKDGKNKLSSGRTYYVAKNGKNRGRGSRNHPFRTLNYAVSRLKKGDTLYIRKGTYREKLKLKAKTSGTDGQYITIQNAPGEKVVLDGRSRKSPKLIDIEGASYVKIQGLELKNAEGQDACGIQLRAGSHHIILAKNKLHDIKVSEPEKEDHCCNGILLFGDSSKNSIHDILIYKNSIYNCQTGWAEALSVTGNVRNINVISNAIKNTGNIGIDFSGNYGYCSNAAKDFPVNAYIYGNKVSQCRSRYATSYGIYVDGGKKINIVKNRVEGCSGGIEIGAEQKPVKSTYSTSDIRVEKNTVINNKENAITVGGYEKKLGWVKNVRIKGNICKNNGLNNAILTLSKCDGVEITDNVFYNKTGDANIIYSEFSSKYTKNILFRRNSYYNGHAKNDTSFVYHGKNYTSFDKWIKKVGKNAGCYGLRK